MSFLNYIFLEDSIPVCKSIAEYGINYMYSEVKSVNLNTSERLM